MRLFVAVDLSPDVTQATAALIERLKRAAREQAPRSRITWSVPERLHITVRFIGHVDDGRAMAVQDALRPTLRLDPFDMTVSGVGAFPRKGPPSVIWAGIGDGADRLREVARMVSDRLATMGVEPETRGYTPHLTLGRVREAAGLRTAVLLGGVGDASLGTVAIDAITLYESRLSPSGSRYLPLVRTGLAGAAGS